MRSPVLLLLVGACSFSGGAGSSDEIDGGLEDDDAAPVVDASDDGFEAQRLGSWTASETGNNPLANNVNQISLVLDSVAVESSVLVLAVSTKRYEVVSQITSAGLTWTKVSEQCSARSQSGVSLWVATSSAPPDNIPVAIQFAGSVQTAVAIAAQYSALPSHLPSLVATNNRTAGTCIESTNIDNDDEDYKMYLDVTPGALVLGAVSLREHNHEYSTLTEVEEVHTGDGGSDSGLVLLEHLGDENSVIEMSGDFDGVGNANNGQDVGNDWGAAIIEVK